MRITFKAIAPYRYFHDYMDYYPLDPSYTYCVIDTL